AVLAGLLCEGVGVKFNGDRAACDDHWFFGHGFASFVAVNEVKGLQLKSAQLLLIGQHVWSREITAISLRAPSLLQVRYRCVGARGVVVRFIRLARAGGSARCHEPRLPVRSQTACAGEILLRIEGCSQG